MKKSLIYLSVALLAIVLCGKISAQTYSKMKVTLKDGLIMDVKKGVLTRDEINFSLGGVPKTLALQEVRLIQAKENRIGVYAAAFGGGCFVICLINSFR